MWVHFQILDGTDFPLLRHCCQVQDLALLRALAGRCERVAFRQRVLCMEQILYLMQDAAMGIGVEPADEMLDEISQDIRREPSRRWTVAELAERSALSRAQFTRRFTAYVGLPPARYMINARIDRARQLLAETTMSVTQIAATLGYPDVASFSRQYRHITGQSPRDVR